ncbi:addiction module toxin, HicA family protein [Betaproteobacteria bacterium]|nr:addiction module toxin, HicA family protein [Betaproteobacteria bacterium]GHU05382.1 addiction module toxin, HicA family protein [Betaproteobacteria bacterium]GHU13942.1 addiction module toxin, HicA family protein [Betaproteobacteria bacterium]GHU20875.1 addiction module toxin, HicA family protein [Betaproteobacteria bacterium]
MNSTEIIRKLEREGWQKAHQVGSHAKFKHPTKPGSVTVPHPRKDIPVGTLRSIYRQAGWVW